MKNNFDINKIGEIFLEGNQLSDFFADYEYRAQQEKMAIQIARAFSKNEHFLIEAGTGTGKSLAYLIPAIFWALAKEEKVVISTNTINLQEQLLDKDLPLLKEALESEFNAILMKGRSNYLCLRRFFQAERSKDLENKEYNDLTKINQWLVETVSGCKSNLDFSLESKVWSKVCSESELCLRGRCPYYSKCFFIKARKEAEEADLLIVNHHLLFADLSLRKNKDVEDQDLILPAYDKLVFDEAHNIEDIASVYLGFNFAQKRIVKKIKELYDVKEDKGLILKLRQANKNLDKSFRKDYLSLLDSQLLPQSKKIYELYQNFFNQIKNLFKKKNLSKLRLTEKNRGSTYWQEAILPQVDNLLVNLQNIINNLKRASNFFTTIVDPTEELEDVLLKVEAMVLFWLELSNKIEEFFISFQADYIYWLEQGKELRFKAAPLNIGEKLYNYLLKKKETVIFTSATLTVENSFDFIKNNLGLDYNKMNTLKLGSPFNYESQLKIGVVNNLVEPGNKEFIAEITESIKKIAMINQGRSLVLFTAYNMLNKVYENLNKQLDNIELDNLYCQGQKSRKYLIKQFKQEEKSILLGTDSFWEGVDIPGDELSYVIIVKLPFLVPNEPVIEARIEALKKQGINPFMNYMLPKAVIKLRQGCGRLIRTRNDNGWVIILDKRVITRSYGNIFLKSLPLRNNFFAGDIDYIRKKIKNS